MLGQRPALETHAALPARIGLCLSLAVIIGAGSVLIFGWGLGIDILRRLAPGYPAMVPATALTLLAGAFGSVALLRRWPLFWTFALAVVILLVVAIESASSLTPEAFRSHDGMSAASATCALLLFLSLLLRALRLHMAPILIETLGLVVASIPLTGYVFGAETLYGNPLYTLMALHTALSHVLLFLALLLSDPRRGWIEVLLAGEPGSKMARRVLPVTILVPLLLALLAAEAVAHNILTVEFRLALLTFLIICSTVIAVISFAHLTNRAERRSLAAETAYLRSEMLRQQTELSAAQAEKVAALGQLVGGVAHDFNNTLNVILGNLELLAEDPDGAKHRTYVDEAIQASNRAADLTRQLLAYGRKSPLNPVPVTFEAEIGTALGMFSRVCPANISIIPQMHTPQVQVRLDASALQQAVLNVLINARDALPEGGTIRLRTQVEKLSGAAVTGFQGSDILPDGTYVTLWIEDNGTGMTPEIAARAAEPFFTTKPVGEGTGLGLSTVAGFCRQSEGGMRIDSAPGSGTSVSLTFPVLVEGAATGAAQDPDDAAAERRLRGVLIVDDDAALTRVMTAQLERVGHQVRVTDTAEAALGLLERGPLPQVVLADIVMPGQMQGHHLAARIRQRHPDIQVILMSGYASAGRRAEIAGMVDLPFLQKPIDQRTLRAIVGGAAPPSGTAQDA